MFIPKGRKKIIKVFLNAPFEEKHLREISRLSGASLTNVDNSLRLFVKEGLFKRRNVSRMSFFKPDLDNGTLLKIFELLEVERKNEFYAGNKKIARLLQKYTDNIVKLSHEKIQAVILFGSVARGEWTKDSDIDILSVVAEKEGDITSILNKAKIDVSPLLAINPVTTTVDKFIEGVSREAEFHDQVWQDRIILYNEFLFWRMIKAGGGKNG